MSKNLKITISETAYSPAYNNGVYYTSLNDLSPYDMFTVSVYARCDKKLAGISEMLIAWGFVKTKDKVEEMTETLLAACELIHNNLKEK